MNDSNPHDETHDLGGTKSQPDDAARTEHPQRIGRYRIEKLLGQGGFGLVYLALDEQLDRLVAIKVPHARLINRPEDAEAYLAEARMVAGLDHPHIVPVYDVGSSAEFPCYIVSKYIEGTDLSTRMKQSRLDFVSAAELVATVAEALHHAHKQGLVDRDVKPGNILLDQNDQPYVVDFGLALREADLGKGPRYAGTPAYMSPEQARGEGHRVDGRSDIYSLGAVLYELLTGRRSVSAETRQELLDHVISQEVKPPRQINDRIPKELERICLKALAKRASDRYTTALDMADDLRHCLATQPHASSNTSAALLGKTEQSDSTTATGDSGTTRGDSTKEDSDSQPIKIVPKGLRSFDAHDADFFLELLPGPRDREGLPDSIRFWKTRIEELDPENTFSVGLIYGPSGCGKSSLVRAGLLPRLSADVIPVYVEATPEDTETRLLHGLRKRCPGLEGNETLRDTLASLRRGQGIPVGKKVLIVLDQFEQWLHAKKEQDNTELVQALRQCDGGRVQCIVMVRDDFWMAATRFMRELEVRLVEAQNSLAVDLFPIRHAKRVLAAFGRSFGSLPDDTSKSSSEQSDFLRQAVAGLAEEGKVICVRLALFAEMMKGKTWTSTTLKEVGGTKGVGVTFLDETFSASTAPPEHRYHQKAARAILKALLPDSVADIKGHMRSRGDLLEASGYQNRPKDFDNLIQILDSEIRLITPTDPEGQESENDSVTTLSSSAEKYYQLTHDYLVSSLRDWLSRKQKETRQGRAEFALADRAAVWTARPENRQLPSVWQWLQIRWYTKPTGWTEPQRQMMRLAEKRHLLHFLGLASVLLVLTYSAIQLNGNLKADALVDRILSANQQELQQAITDSNPYRHWVVPRLRRQVADAMTPQTDRRKLHARLALLGMGDEEQLIPVQQELSSVDLSYMGVIRKLLEDHKTLLTDDLWQKFNDDTVESGERFRAGLLLAAFAADSQRWREADSEFLASQFVSTNPIHQAATWDCLRMISTRLQPYLEDVCVDPQAPDSVRIAAANAMVDLAVVDRKLIASVMVQATPAQFQIFYPHLADADETIRNQLRTLVRQQPTQDLTEAERILLGRRRAGASIFLLRQGEVDIALECLRVGNDPESLTQFVHQCRAKGVAIGQLIDCLVQVDQRRRPLTGEKRIIEDRALYGLLLALGEFDVTDLTENARDSLLPRLAKWYVEDPSACVHSVTGWLLRRWDQHQVVDAVDQTESPYSPDREWFVHRVSIPADATSGIPFGQDALFFTFIVVERGEYTIGSPMHERNRSPDEPVHTVVLNRRFAVLDREITRMEYELFRGESRSTTAALIPTGDHPIVLASWYRAVEFCRWLSANAGYGDDEQCFADPAALDPDKFAPDPGAREFPFNWEMDPTRHAFRLPTEAEWEVMCRAGTVSTFHFGSDREYLPQYAWFEDNTSEGPQPVKLKRPSIRGFFDLHGNVFEWCYDWYGGSGDYAKNRTDWLGPDVGTTRVMRGGGWRQSASYCRTADRDMREAKVGGSNVGFRLAVTLPTD